MTEMITLPEDYAIAANVPSAVPEGSLLTYTDRAKASLFGLNFKISLLQSVEQWKEFSGHIGHEVAQQKRIELFQAQFRASCVVSELCKQAGVEVWP